MSTRGPRLPSGMRRVWRHNSKYRLGLLLPPPVLQGRPMAWGTSRLAVVGRGGATTHGIHRWAGRAKPWPLPGQYLGWGMPALRRHRCRSGRVPPRPAPGVADATPFSRARARSSQPACPARRRWGKGLKETPCILQNPPYTHLRAPFTTAEPTAPRPPQSLSGLQSCTGCTIRRLPRRVSIPIKSSTIGKTTLPSTTRSTISTSRRVRQGAITGVGTALPRP